MLIAFNLVDLHNKQVSSNMMHVNVIRFMQINAYLPFENAINRVIYPKS
jgi:hypothetical protein